MGAGKGMGEGEGEEGEGLWDGGETYRLHSGKN